MAYFAETTLRWAIEDTVSWKRPEEDLQDEVFLLKREAAERKIMIVNNHLAPLTEKITNLYWAEETHVGRINVIVQYILEHEAAQQSAQVDLLTVCQKCGGWLKGGECENCSSPISASRWVLNDKR